MTVKADQIDAVIAQLSSEDIDLRGLAVTGRILRLASHITDGRCAVLTPLGLTIGDFDVLTTLRRSGDLKPTEITQAVMITSGGMTKRLDRLEQLGFLARSPDPNDRRGSIIQLTAKGRKIVDAASGEILRIELDFVNDAIPSARSRTQLISQLRRLLNASEPGN